MIKNISDLDIVGRIVAIGNQKFFVLAESKTEDYDYLQLFNIKAKQTAIVARFGENIVPVGDLNLIADLTQEMAAEALKNLNLFKQGLEEVLQEFLKRRK